ncbi:MAG: chemotaxis protein CheD [bacterium]|jgi:chemotaxis protein CheD
MKFAQKQNLPYVYLKPAEAYISGGEQSIVGTILGSCVSITVFHRKKMIGGIFHALLPRKNKVKQFQVPTLYDLQEDDILKYVDTSFLYLLREFEKLQCPREELEIKLFGGADMFSVPDETKTVGRQNIELATDLLNRLGFKVLASDTGGKNGRKLYFYTHTGEVLLQRIKRNAF